MSEIKNEEYPNIPFNSDENNAETPKPKKKKSMKIFLSVMVVIFVIVGIAGVGFAKKIKNFHDHGPLGFMMEKMTEDLDLSVQQKADVQKIKDEIKAKMDSKKEDHKSMGEDMGNMFRQSTLDKQKILDLAASREKNREEMKSFMIDELIKFHDLLTDAQRNKVADKMKDFHDKMQQKKDNDNDKRPDRKQ